MTKEELARVISETKRELDEGDDDEDGEHDNTMETSDNEDNPRPQQSNRSAAGAANPDDEFNFSAYDDEEATQVAAISDIATVDPNDDENASDGEDSEAEDDKIKPNDNLVLVGHVDDDAASLEVYGQLRKMFDVKYSTIITCL